MKNKNVRGILALAVVTALSFGVILGSKALAVETEIGGDAAAETVKEELDVIGAENIEEASVTEYGDHVSVKAKGYGGDILMKVSFGEDKKTVTKAEVLEQTETEGLGARIAEPEFLSQFDGVEAPVYLPGMEVASSEEEAETEAPKEDALEGAVFTDGDYIAKSEAADDNGFVEQVTMTVKDGKITAVNWDAITEDGTKKSVMSENGEYVMTEDGPTWKEQAEALANALIENQNLTFLTTDEQGKTDAVSGVSISVGSFISLAEQCLNEAAGVEVTEAPEEETQAPAEGTLVDAVSGATISSTAAVTAINDAYAFLQTVN